MNHKKWVGLILLAAFFIVGCEAPTEVMTPEKSGIGQDDEMSSLDRRGGHRNPYPADAGSGEFIGYNDTENGDYGVYSYTLWSHRTHDMGDVTITNNADGVPVVTVTTNDEADLANVRVFVWSDQNDVPSHRPPPGHADYSLLGLDASEVSITLDDHASQCGDLQYITVRAILRSQNNNDDDDEDDDEEDDDEDDDDGGCGGGHGGGHGGHGGGHGNNGYGLAYAGGSNVEDDGFPYNRRKPWWGYVTYSATCFQTITGTVYEDADNSGDLSPGEGGFENVEVSLYDGFGDLLTTTLSDIDGGYAFNHLANGADFLLTSDVPAGDFIAVENSGGIAVTGLSGNIGDANYGFAPLAASASISGLIYEDLNNSGTLDGDDEPLGGFPVELQTAAGAPVASTFSDPDGFYFFTDVEAGLDYIVYVDINPIDYLPLENNGLYFASDLEGDLVDIHFGYSSDTSIQTAFAYLPGSSDSFTDLGLTMTQWGWQISLSTDSPGEEIPIYANAVDNDLSNGTQIGVLLVGYDQLGGELFVGIELFSGWELNQTNVYLSDDPIQNPVPSSYGIQTDYNGDEFDFYSLPFFEDGDGVIYFVFSATVTAVDIPI